MVNLKPDILSIDSLKALTRHANMCIAGLALAMTLNVCPAYSQQIIVDGKTNTNLINNGNVTNISTTTIVNGKAFNSFRVFNVGQGQVVNLIIPGNSSHLINVVSDQATNISGVLNALQNNHVGGNVILINPHGIAVSSSGVVNVGSLTAITPTQTFVDNFFDSPGNPNAASVTALMNGNAPVNENAAIINAGEINAITDVKLDTGLFTNTGNMYTNAIFQENNIAIGDVVNVNTPNFVADINDLVLSNGKITINAANGIVNNGNIFSGEEIALATTNGDITGTGLYKTTDFIVDAGGSFGSEQNLVKTEISGKANIKAENGIYLHQQTRRFQAEKLETTNGDIILEAPNNSAFIDRAIAPGKIKVTSGGQWVKFGFSDSEELDIEMTNTGGRVDLTESYVSNNARIRANELYGNFYGSGKTPLSLDIRGVNDTRADRVIIGITSPHDATITDLAARSATLHNFVDGSLLTIESFEGDFLRVDGRFLYDDRMGGGLFPHNNTPVSSVSIAADTGLIASIQTESKAEIGADLAQSSRSAEEMEKQASQARRSRGRRTTTSTKLVEIVDPQLYLSKYYEKYTVQVLDKAYNEYINALAQNKTDQQAIQSAINYLVKSKMNSSIASELVKRQPFNNNAYYKMFLTHLKDENYS